MPRTEQPYYMWRVTVSRGMGLEHCAPWPPFCFISTQTNPSVASHRGQSRSPGVPPDLDPPWWAAAKDHGPAVAAQAPQYLPAPVHLHQSPPSLLLPPVLLPGCSDAAPAWTRHLLPPRVGRQRTPTTLAEWRRRGERPGQTAITIVLTACKKKSKVSIVWCDRT